MGSKTRCLTVIVLAFAAACGFVSCGNQEMDSDGDVIDGDVFDGDVLSDRDTHDGDDPDGDQIDGDQTDGDQIDGDDPVDGDIPIDCDGDLPPPRIVEPCEESDECVEVSCFDGDLWCYDINGDRNYKDEDCGVDACIDGNCKTSVGSTLIWVPVPAGSFEMGCPPGNDDCHSSDSPSHTVHVSAFEMTQTEVTREQFNSVVGSKNRENNECPTCPIENIDWYDAKAFCEAAGGRLPSEAEWEYAARAGTTTKYYCGDHECCLLDIAWFASNSEELQPVAQKKANTFGLYDMLGNVREWVEECYHKNYEGAPNTEKYWEGGDCSKRIARGGSWYDWDYANWHMSVYLRFRLNPEHGEAGIRCVRDRDPDPVDGDTTDGDSSDGDTAEGEAELCTSHESYTCSSDDLYWYDSCGNMEEKKEECGDSECCDGKCIDSSLFNCCNGICTDPVTGFEWQQINTGGSMEWVDANRHCRNLTLGGRSWRLPNISELRSLIRNCEPIETGGSCMVNDECAPCGVSSSEVCLVSSSCKESADCYPPSCSNDGGPTGCYWPEELDGTCSYYWSSSMEEEFNKSPFCVLFHIGQVHHQFSLVSLRVRCVRGP